MFRYLLLGLLLGLAACAPDSEATVVTTTGMVGDVVKTVGGDCVEVAVMMGPGIDPHLYQASAGDVRTLQNADMIFYSGLHLEGQLGEVFEALGDKRPVIAVAERAVPEERVIRTEDSYGVDPHVWMDAGLWALTVDVVAEALTELEPACAEAIRSRANDFKRQLVALDAWARESVASIPAQQRILVTAHDAFAYYSRAYDIDVAGIQGISTESEAAIADIRNTVDTVVERRVPALFVESTINSRTVEAVRQAAFDRGQRVVVGGELFSDAMGEAGTAAGTYIGMIYSNTKTITEALGGSAPPLPADLSNWAQTWGIGDG